MGRCKRFVVMTALGLALVGGCKDKAKDKASDKPSDKATDPAGAPTPGVPAGKTGDLELLPLDSEVVLAVDWAQFQGTTIWKDLALPALMKESDVVEVITEIKTRCGFDFVTGLERVAIGVKGIDAELPDGVAVLHGLDKAKTLACADKWQADAVKEQVTYKNEGGVVTAIDPDGYGIGLVFIADTVALAVIGHGMSADRIKKAAAGDSALAKSATFVDMYSKIDPKATVWGFVRGNAMQSEVADLIGVRPKAVFGFIDFGNGLSGRIRARLESPAQATETASGLRGQIDAIAQMVDKAAIRGDGSDVELEVTATPVKLKSLIAMLGDM